MASGVICSSAISGYSDKLFVGPPLKIGGHVYNYALYNYLG